MGAFGMVLSLVEELVSHVESKPPVRVNMVFIGQGFTAVKLVNGDVGLASSPLTRFDTCIGVSRVAGSFTRYDSRELARFMNLGQPAHLRSIGLAAVNAVLQGELRGRSDFLEGDFLKFLSVRRGENVAMVDYYTTKIESLKSSNLTVFDDRFAGKRRDVSILPLSALPKQLPDADVVIVPPTFIGRVEDLRQYASHARHFVVVHPTTPPLPEPFFEKGVTLVASMMILDDERLLKYVMEGAGTTLFKKFCRKIVFVKN